MQRFFVVAAFLATGASAWAQNPQPSAPENPTVQVAPQNAPSAPPERIAPSGRAPSGAAGTLSDQLSRQHGTISPPNVDPGMTVGPTTGAAGRTPVIPPPGSPGGNPTVVPK